ncbi:MAG: TonB-dependent receptor [Bacteroidia bacterium]|nr:TonB-dependent receptor [Bacteroidia bacterium]MDW8089703.1 TonB-dependent receptor [Bacteroidia bacterium]
MRGRLSGCLVLAWGFGQSLHLLSEEGTPIIGATVQLVALGSGRSLQLVTDSSGSLQVAPGAYRLRIQAEGFLPLEDTFSLPLSEPVRLLRPTYVLQDHVITGSYAPLQELRNLYPVRILTAERLQAQGSLYLSQALLTELNARLWNDPNLGLFAVLQGLGGEHIKVLLDGVPIIGRVGGAIDLQQLPLGEVERVEIVEGPMSVLYGSDALGGVINLITRRSRCQWEARGRLQYEGVGVYETGFSLAGGPLRHRLFISGSRYYFDGWDPNPHRPRARLWRPREQYNALVAYHWTRSSRSSLRLSLPFGDEMFFNLREPTVTPYRVYAIDEYYHTRRFLPAVTFSHTFSPRLRWHHQGAFLYYRRIRQVVYKDLVTLEEMPVPLPGLQDTTQEYQAWTRGGLSATTAWGSWQIGTELQHTWLRGGRIRDGQADMGDYAVWGLAERNLTPSLTLAGGFRWAYNTRYKAPFLPTFHLRWSPNALFSFRVGYSCGFRAPSLREQFLYLVFTNHNVQGNPNLQPERSHHLHTSGVWTHATSQRLWRLSLSSFYNYLQDVIQLVLVDPRSLFSTYQNLQRFWTFGFQPKLEFRTNTVGLWTGVNFTAYRGHSWGWEYVLQPTLSGRRWHLNAFFKYQGRVPIFLMQADGTVAWRWIGGFPWLDVSLGWRFAKNHAQALVGLRNLFGITSVQANLAGGIHAAAESQAPIGMGRFPFFRLEYHFQRGQL